MKRTEAVLLVAISLILIISGFVWQYGWLALIASGAVLLVASVAIPVKKGD